MGWRERDYSQDTWTERGSARPASRWPAPAVATLLIVHLLAFVGVQMLRSTPDGAAIVERWSLSQASARVPGIVLHPFATRDVLTLALTLLLIWSLGGKIERQDGRWRLVTLYLAGNLLAGLAFFGVARAWPTLTRLALDYPVGACAAWAVAAYRGMSGGVVVLFGRLWNVAHVVGIALAASIGLMLALHWLAAVGWLAAVAAGGLGEPTVARLAVLATFRPRRHRPVAHTRAAVEAPVPPEAADEPDIDDILAKISRTGLGSLTPDERNRLEAARQAKLRKSRGQSVLH